MLLHKNDEEQTPLDLAIEKNNKKAIHLIIRNLAVIEKVDAITTDSMKQHFSLLVQYETFEDFLSNCFFQTHQMNKIESLNAIFDQGEDQLIVAHNTCFLDETFMERYTSEVEQERFVTVQAIEAKWMLNTQEGEDFMYALMKVESPTMFTNEAIQALIRF